MSERVKTETSHTQHLQVVERKRGGRRGGGLENQNAGEEDEGSSSWSLTFSKPCYDLDLLWRPKRGVDQARIMARLGLDQSRTRLGPWLDQARTCQDNKKSFDSAELDDDQLEDTRWTRPHMVFNMRV